MKILGLWFKHHIGMMPYEKEAKDL
jgi:hypothetical protein